MTQKKKEVRTAVGKGLKSKFLGENTGMKNTQVMMLYLKKLWKIKEICKDYKRCRRLFFFFQGGPVTVTIQEYKRLSLKGFETARCSLTLQIY